MARFVARLRSQVEFVCESNVDGAIGRFDAAQLEQALLNLLKNAHESGSPAERRHAGRCAGCRMRGASRCSIAAAA